MDAFAVGSREKVTETVPFISPTMTRGPVLPVIRTPTYKFNNANNNKNQWRDNQNRPTGVVQMAAMPSVYRLCFSIVLVGTKDPSVQFRVVSRVCNRQRLWLCLWFSPRLSSGTCLRFLRSNMRLLEHVC